MNDFLTKLLLEKEKGFKSLEEKKKGGRKEIFYDFNDEPTERVKRDAMSQYQEDKTHHKRSSNYGDLAQWDIQNANNHNRRGHFPFGASSQGHPMSWSPLGMGIPRQTNPYYSNPHSHVMPAHAHSEYRYNQWNNPNQKNIPNIQNAHSQNAILPQSRMDGKHRPDISSSLTDFGLPSGATADFSKLRNNHRDMMLRSQTTDKASLRPAGIHPDHLAPMSAVTRNPGGKGAPLLTNHPKAMIGNPLTDLQMLVTNQENESSEKKSDSYQQESVDLSAHTDASKQKGNSIRKEEKSLHENNTHRNVEHRSMSGVIQTQKKQVLGSADDACEKPMELTSKNSEKKTGTEISSAPFRSSTLENNCTTDATNAKHGERSNKKELTSKSQVGEPERVRAAVENDETVSDDKVKKSEEFIPKKVESSVSESEKGETGDSLPEVVTKAKTESDDKNQSAQPSPTILVGKVRLENGENPRAQELTQKETDDVQNGKRKTADDQSDRDCKRTCVDGKPEVPEGSSGAGEENSDPPTVSSTSTEMRPQPNETGKKTPKKKPSKKSKGLRPSSGQNSSSESQLSHNKKLTSLSGKEETRKKMKKGLCDTVDRRGPFLHLEGSRESPSAVTVINYPKGDDEDEKDKSAGKKQTLNSSRTKHHNELDYRGKSKNGLFSSTLSSRYDAHTTDRTWVCVFCKKGPHYNTLGDLFGPYIISREDNNSSACDFSGDEKDISDAQKRGGRNKKSLRSNNMVEHFQKMSKKLRRTQSTDSSLVGMTVIPDDETDQTRYEVWVHEQCAIWSPNVCLIGSRIIGMQEAIWSSVKTMCSKCGSFGANIGCVFRNCPNRSHYHCAKENEWSLEQETFISTCQIHKPRS